MRIVFVRHGHPDYAKDCLTELGHKHARAAAERLKNERPMKIYASTCGRARETAEHVAAPHKIDIIPLEFMREIGWGSKNGEPILKGGHPWYIADDLILRAESVIGNGWQDIEAFSNNKVTDCVEKVVGGIDQLLAELGYQREGLYYRVTKDNPDTVFLVSHGGSSSAAISHMINIPFPNFCATIRPKFTAITVITLSGEVGSLVTAHVELMNDARHIEGIE